MNAGADGLSVRIDQNVDSLYVAASGIAAVAGLGLAWVFAGQVNRADPGSDRMQELMAAIREGAMAFLRRQYGVLAIFVVVVALLIFAIPDYRLLGAAAYLGGALASGGAGFIGMRIATAANARTAEAARTGGVQAALPLAFRGGAVMGFSVAGLGLLGVTALFFLFVQATRLPPPTQHLVTCNAFRDVRSGGGFQGERLSDSSLCALEAPARLSLESASRQHHAWSAAGS